MNDLSKSYEFSKSPNPPSSIIEINSVYGSIENVQIFTMVGIELTQAIVIEESKLEIEKSNKGVFLIKFTNNFGSQIVLKFVKE